MGALLRGLWLELRVIPVLLWSFSAITLGTALACRDRPVHGWYYLGAALLGLLIQGVLAHTVNELEDWRSGTDRHASPRVISGGSKVLVSGLLSERGLKLLFVAAFAATTVLGLLLCVARGWVMLPFGLAGVAGAVLYTLPPVRAAYRPFLGEAVACGCLWLCVTGAAVLQGGTIDAVTAGRGAGGGGLRGRHADGAPLPRLRGRPLGGAGQATTIVLLGRGRGHRYAIGWCGLALADGGGRLGAGAAAAPLAVAYAVGLGFHVRCRPADVGRSPAASWR